jgi:hypothetical protein
LVQQRRFCINPNEGFMAQLNAFEWIYKAQLTLQNGQCLTEKGQNKRRIDQVDDLLSGQAEILVAEAMDMTCSWYAASWYVIGLMVLLNRYWYKFCVFRLGDLDAGNMVTILWKHNFVKKFWKFFLIVGFVVLLQCSRWVSHGYLKNERICILSLIEEHEVDLHRMGGGLMVTDGGQSAFSSEPFWWPGRTSFCFLQIYSNVVLFDTQRI